MTRFKNVAFHVKIFLRTNTKGPPPRCLPQGPHHPRSTPDVDECYTDLSDMCKSIYHVQWWKKESDLPIKSTEILNMTGTPRHRL